MPPGQPISTGASLRRAADIPKTAAASTISSDIGLTRIYTDMILGFVPETSAPGLGGCLVIQIRRLRAPTMP